MAGPNLGQTGGQYGPYDPRKKESSRFEYFKAVQTDLNKRYGTKGGAPKKKGTPTKEK